MFCTNCGNPVTKSIVFCTKCGHRLTKVTKTATSTALGPVVSEMEHQAAANASKARSLEKSDPEAAIGQYCKSIAIRIDMSQELPNQLKKGDIPYLYNRLTMLMEKQKQYQRALDEIRVYESLPSQQMGGKSDIKAIDKRKLRLISKKRKLRLSDEVKR